MASQKQKPCPWGKGALPFVEIDGQVEHPQVRTGGEFHCL